MDGSAAMTPAPPTLNLERQARLAWWVFVLIAVALFPMMIGASFDFVVKLVF
jgi:hypothetical protein